MGTIEVAEGPVALALDEPRDRLYVLSRFTSAIEVIDTTTNQLLTTIAFHDPTPDVIVAGRPHLYDTHQTSGLGQTSCASCHIDGKMDPLGWDLGDPSGDMKAFNQVCLATGDSCDDWHPLKGPLTTQTLVGTVGAEPLHWRGDRENLAAFAGAFVGLLGDDVEPDAAAMQEFEDFVATMQFPPNPFRNLDNTVKDELFPNNGNPADGEQFFHNVPVDRSFSTCVFCHSSPLGGDPRVVTKVALGLATFQDMKVSQLSNMYEKTGLDKESTESTRGFGFTHDGAVGNIVEFLHTVVFEFEEG